MARPLVQCTLPHRNPGDVPTFTRSAGNLRLTIQPFLEERRGKIVNYGLPYGTIPRLILAWLFTEVVKTRSKEIPLGDSLSSFMSELDMVPTGGRWGTITRLREQVKRLFSCTFSIVYEDKENFSLVGFKLAQKAHFLWDTVNPGQGNLLGSSIMLSDEFYREIISRPIPIDTRILKALKKSPFAIDLYTWLTYRTSYIKGETVIPWQSLQDQFGADYAETRFFKVNLIKTLNKILALYPAKVRPEEKGLILMPSSPSVPRKK